MDQTKKFSLARWVWGALWVAYAALIFYLSSQALPDEESLLKNIPFGDKGAHAGEYLIFGLLTFLTFRPRTGSRWVFGLFIALGYAASDEIHQAFVPMRDPSFFDWTADAVGILASAPGYSWISWIRSRVPEGTG